MPATLHAAFSMHQPHIDSGRASMTFEETVETQFVQPVQALLSAGVRQRGG